MNLCDEILNAIYYQSGDNNISVSLEQIKDYINTHFSLIPLTQLKKELGLMSEYIIESSKDHYKLQQSILRRIHEIIKPKTIMLTPQIVMDALQFLSTHEGTIFLESKYKNYSISATARNLLLIRDEYDHS